MDSARDTMFFSSSLRLAELEPLRPSVLSIMEDHLNKPGKPGEHSMLAAMGPAFCSELVVLQW